MEKAPKTGDLTELAKIFLWLGCVGFGGPAVHIAMMEEELVRKRKWLRQEHFLDLVGATSLIPGPNSTEMTMHIGQERAGWKGLVVAGLCFIVPAVIITAVFAWLYQQYGQLPAVQPFMYGVKPAIIAVVCSLMIRLGKKAVKSVWLAVIGLLASAAVLAGYNEIYILFGGGAIGVVLYLLRQPHKKLLSFFPLAWLPAVASSSGLSATTIFLIFLKIGAILYGSGYVLFAFLDAELVAKGLLSKQELVDAIAVGQFTPGPVFSSATFIGWQMSGLPGALAATAGIFLPSFVFVAVLNPLIPKLRRSRVFGVFLDTVNVISIALILSLVVEIGSLSLSGWRTFLIAAGSFLVTFYFKKLNTAYVILGGSILGYILTFI